ncbi:MAG TPA: M23 family peptidase [Treponema sp.]|nr:MAG: hypothetical protein A2001_15210 [Treponema sp. GWC1_61_84]OHE72288.1 MAG: hypothetical protein A2413_14885 [Treponema sp. RIFOXYC1_FULL_61_9]HCM28278.1 M23 family peptidase [Treponema sp.]
MSGRLAGAFCLLLAAVASAASPAYAQGPATQGPAAQSPSVRESAAVSFLLADEALPGAPVTVILAFPDLGAFSAYASARVSLRSEDGRELASARFFPIDAAGSGAGALAAALLAVPFTVPPMRASVMIEGCDAAAPADFRTLPLLIQPRSFTREEIALDQTNSLLRNADDPRKAEESRVLWTLLNRFETDAPRASGPFKPPVPSTRRTSGFGDRRTYIYNDGSKESAIHAGIDFGIPRGESVRACASGIVVMARYRIVTGNSVVLSHYPGVYSLYYHLDGLEVAEGDRIEAGDLVGKSGSTGLSTGPHLHWEIRIAGNAADPDALVAGGLLDKEAVISKIQTKYGR